MKNRQYKGHTNNKRKEKKTLLFADVQAILAESVTS
jgi:hypothetical protein